MSFYWRVTSFPELEHLSEKERAHIVAQCFTWITWFGLIVRSVVLGASFSLLLAFLAEPFLGTFPSPVFECTLPMTVILSYQLLMTMVRGSLRTFLEKAARTKTLAFCIGCGYSLIGNESERCPECGQARPVAEKLDKK